MTHLDALSKLSEQKAVLQLHTALGPRKRAFEEKAAGLLKQIADRQAALAGEAALKRQVLDDHRKAEDRKHHLTQLDNAEAMFASVSVERSALTRAREEKEESHLSKLQADRHAMEDHVKETERAHAELTTRIKRMEAELAHAEVARRGSTQE
jgi:chromosome segregation ATPase